LRTIKKIELSKCVAACGVDKSCQAYSFDKWNKWCFLKSKVSSLILEPSTISGMRKSGGGPSASSNAIRMDRRDGKSFQGTHVRDATPISPDLCEQACQQDKECLGFTFSKQKDGCRLFGDIATLSLDKNAISGVKTQYAQ